MMVHHEHRVIWVSVARTGTHTMYEMLPRYGFESVGDQHHRKLPAKCRAYDVMAVVRNPYARAVSLWWLAIHGQSGRRTEMFQKEFNGPDGLTRFCEYLIRENGDETHPFAATSLWLRAFDVKHVLHTETLADDFERLPFVGERVVMPHLLSSHALQQGRGPWQDRMTPEIVESINEWAAGDFEAYGYERMEVACAS